MLTLIKRLSLNHWPVFLLGNISSVINLLLPIILVRLFSPEDMGLYKTFFLYLSLIPFVVMAGGPLNSVYYWMGKTQGRDEYLQATWLVTLFLSSLIFIPGTVAILLFHQHFSLSIPVLFMLMISGFLVCPSGHYSEVSIAKGNVFVGAGLSVCFEVIKTIGFIFIAWKYRDITTLFTYFFALMIMSSIFMTYLGLKNHSVTFKWDKIRAKEILKYSMPVSLSSCLLFITEKADLLIISAYVSVETFAYYSFGCLLIPPLYLLENSIQKHLIPKLSLHFEQKNYTQMVIDFKKAISDISFLMIPAIFGLIIFAGPIIKILYTSRYADSAVYLKIFALSYILLMIPHDSILRASAKTDTILKIYCYLVPVSFFIIYLSVRFLDLKWALAIGLFLKLLPKLYCLNISARIIQHKVTDLIPYMMLIKYTLMAAFLSAVSLLVKPIFTNELQWFLVITPLFATTYILFFVLQKSRSIELFN